MTHEYSKRYASKHPPGTKPNEEIARRIQEKSPGNELACGMAERISKELKVSLSEVGITADLLGIKIKQCQLGLFGWGDGPNHGKAIQAAHSVSEEIKNALEGIAQNGRITCAEAWAIADRLGTERRTVSIACETLGLKIRACQLGTF